MSRQYGENGDFRPDSPYQRRQSLTSRAASMQNNNNNNNSEPSDPQRQLQQNNTLLNTRRKLPPEDPYEAARQQPLAHQGRELTHAERLRYFRAQEEAVPEFSQTRTAPKDAPQVRKYRTFHDLVQDLKAKRFHEREYGVYEKQTRNKRYTYKFSWLDKKRHLNEKIDYWDSEMYNLKYNIHYIIFDKQTGKQMFSTYEDQFGRPARAGRRVALGYRSLPHCVNDALYEIPFGRKARVECPSGALWYHLGYKSRDGRLVVEPNQDLVYHIEMLPKHKQFFEVTPNFLSTDRPVHNQDESEWPKDKDTFRLF